MFSIPDDARPWASLAGAVVDEMGVGVNIIKCVRRRDVYPRGVVEIRLLSVLGIALEEFPSRVEIECRTWRSRRYKNLGSGRVETKKANECDDGRFKHRRVPESIAIWRWESTAIKTPGQWNRRGNE